MTVDLVGVALGAVVFVSTLVGMAVNAAIGTIGDARRGGETEGVAGTVSDPPENGGVAEPGGFATVSDGLSDVSGAADATDARGAGR